VVEVDQNYTLKLHMEWSCVLGEGEDEMDKVEFHVEGSGLEGDEKDYTKFDMESWELGGRRRGWS
jgi:hypothetical protein